MPTRKIKKGPKPVTKAEVRETLRRGGERFFQQAAAATIYDVHGVDRERSTAAGRTTFVRDLLSPKLDLTPRQRAVGTCFGAYFEQVHTGGGKQFLRDYVDTTPGVSPGVSEAVTHRMAMVTCAIRALRGAPDLRYPLGQPRGGAQPGQHLPVGQLQIAYDICVAGRTLSYVAITHGWVMRTAERGKTKSRVPDRQRKALAAGLREALDVVSEAWEAAGYRVPFDLSQIDTE